MRDFISAFFAKIPFKSLQKSLQSQTVPLDVDKHIPNPNPNRNRKAKPAWVFGRRLAWPTVHWLGTLRDFCSPVCHGPMRRLWSMSLDNECGIEIRHRFGIDFGIDCGLAYRSTGTCGHVYRFGFNWQLAIGNRRMANGAWCMRQAARRIS